MQQALALSLAAHVFADWQNNTAVFIIEYLCHSEVDSARATEDAFKTCDSTNQLATSEITSSQQSKQDGQRTKYHLFRRWVAQRTNEHKASENAPQSQVPPHERRRACRQSHVWHYDQTNQRQPEQTVRSKCRCTEVSPRLKHMMPTIT